MVLLLKIAAEKNHFVLYLPIAHILPPPPPPSITNVLLQHAPMSTTLLYQKLPALLFARLALLHVDLGPTTTIHPILVKSLAAYFVLLVLIQLLLMHLHALFASWAPSPTHMVQQRARHAKLATTLHQSPHPVQFALTALRAI